MFKRVKSPMKLNLVLLTSVTLGLTACSSDVTRFAMQDAQARQAATANQQVTQTQLAPLAVSKPATPTYNQTNVASRTAPSTSSDFTASIPSSSVASRQNSGYLYNPSPDTHRVSTGETLYSISKRYGVNVESLRQVNGFTPASVINIGQIIHIPRRSAAPQAYSNGSSNIQRVMPQSTQVQNVNYAPRVTPSVKAPEITTAPIVAPAVASSSNGVHVVQPKETLYSISRRYGVSVAQLTAMNGLSVNQGLKIGQQLRVNGSAPAVQAAPKAAPVAPAVVPAAPKAAPVVAQKPKVNLPTPQARSSERFRWPVSGRVISEYGQKPDGRRNDGINIAVPPGTVVKAAENGVVAYAGNELKSYGNLVLVKHDGGWVTAYAHNGSILVKKGDTVRRGQAIARSGQSGEVTKPQLHFEIRRGALAQNPRNLLAAN